MLEHLLSRIPGLLLGVMITGYGLNVWKTGYIANGLKKNGIVIHAGGYAKPIAIVLIVIGMYVLWLSYKSFKEYFTRNK